MLFYFKKVGICSNNSKTTRSKTRKDSRAKCILKLDILDILDDSGFSAIIPYTNRFHLFAAGTDYKTMLQKQNPLFTAKSAVLAAKEKIN